jgi:hypothetical protein
MGRKFTREAVPPNHCCFSSSSGLGGTVFTPSLPIYSQGDRLVVGEADQQGPKVQTEKENKKMDYKIA